MKKKAKRFIYRLAKFFGFFKFADILYKNRVLIITYHGFSILDEHEYLPELFIRLETLEQRLKLIKKYGYLISTLEEGLKVYEEAITKKSLIVTVDDGFSSTLSVAAPLFKKEGIHFTLYLTTYYVLNNLPIWDLSIRYILWKAKVSFNDPIPFELLSSNRLSEMENLNWDQIIPLVKANRSEIEKQNILKQTAEFYGISLSTIIEKRIFHLLNANDLLKLINDKNIIGLHTHRHYVHHDYRIMEKEIRENQEIIKTISQYYSDHFCYPSGLYTPGIIKHLQALNIRTATTCEPGLWTKNTNPYAIPRFLDSESISMIEFEAELSGFAELVRKTAEFFRV